MEHNKYDVIVVGSGPAGLTVAMYLIRNNLKIALFSGNTIGGQLTTTTDIENYPGFIEPLPGFELMNNMLLQAQRLGVEIVYDEITNLDFDKPFKCHSNSGVYVADRIVIATGASPRWLVNVPNEEKWRGKGISVCATCDGNFYKGKDVVVVGGGESAAIETLHLAGICNKVYLVNRSSKLRMSQKQIEKIKGTPNIELLLDRVIVEIVSKDNRIIDAVKIENPTNNEVMTINVNGIFCAIGNDPSTAIFKNSGLKLDNKGYIITEHDGARTNIESVYAVGDVTNKPFKQAVIAAGYGAICAMEIMEDIKV
ncbi:MAG: FAD-dependent oxidoreductase [Rickettsiales bacterium]|jgi:thioredoxin reductase (NADPH)|nr:FAD-dependent oxidoreductase [Rickettsiales bacterium]